MEQKFNEKLYGLSSAEIRTKRDKYGLNVYEKDQNDSALRLVLAQFQSPLTVILLVVVAVSFYTAEHINAIVILMMLMLNALLGFVQEYKARKSLEKLHKLIKVSIKVKRNGKVQTIDSGDLVPGDVVYLNHGSVVPADIKLVQTNNLYLNEAALSGESREVERKVGNIVHQGTSVVEGSAIGIVEATGSRTLLAQSVSLRKRKMTMSNYTRNINKFSKMLFYFVIVITSVTILINVSLGRDFLASFVLGLSLALGITPETMPVVISIALSTAAFKLTKNKVLIKRLPALEDFGNVDVICTDKTGTITLGELQLLDWVDLQGKKNPTILEYGAICSGLNPNTDNKILENQIDKQIWKIIEKEKLESKIADKPIKKIWDFSFELRSMGVVIEESGKELVIVKGSYESVFEICKDHKGKTEFETLIKNYEEKGFKVLAVATKMVDLARTKRFPSKLKKMTDMDIQGFLLFKDVPRENMLQEFNKLEKLNVDLKILTGDSAEITKYICHEVDLEIAENRMITGAELEKAQAKNTEEFDRVVNTYNVFVRVSPLQKLNIIESLKRNKHVVAYLGDGINDVGALEAADVSIAVDSATDVAKDTADVIILDKKLSTVESGIIEGRKIFANTMKFIFGTMSSSFGNVITIAFASLFLPFIPLLPVQVILIDFLSDFQHLAISTDNVDQSMIAKPRNWNFKVFYKYIIFWGLLSTVFDFFHIVVIKSITNSPEMFRTTWIIESITTEIFATFALRTAMPFYKSRPSNLMLLFSAIPVLTIVFLSYIAFGDEIFFMVPPGLSVLGVVLVIVLIYFAALEIGKKSYFRDFWEIKQK